MCKFRWDPRKTHLRLATILERPKLIPEDVIYDREHLAASEQILSELPRPESMADSCKQTVKEALHIGNAICSLAAKDDSNIIFIGGTGKSAIARFFLGSTSRYVLHHAECSLWISRKKGWR